MRGSKFLLAPCALLAVAALAAPAAAQVVSFANDDEYTTQMNTPVAIDPQANDTFPSGSTVVDFFVKAQPAHGDVDQPIANYTPDTGFVGDDVFEYTVCYSFLDNFEGSGRFGRPHRTAGVEPFEQCDDAQVTIHVVAPPTTTTTVASTTTTRATTTTLAVQVVPTQATTTTVAAAAELPRTGDDSSAAIAIAVGAVVFGAGALAVARKRQPRKI